MSSVTPTPPLTEEELAEIVTMLSMGQTVIAPNLWRSWLGRLIADLRASRARVKELEDGIEAFLSGKNPL